MFFRVFSSSPLENSSGSPIWLLLKLYFGVLENLVQRKTNTQNPRPSILCTQLKHFPQGLYPLLNPILTRSLGFDGGKDGQYLFFHSLLSFPVPLDSQTVGFYRHLAWE